MRILFIAIITLVVACGKEETKKEVIVIPPNALFVINDVPKPSAYKVDTTKDWVILDSTATLKVLLKMVEDNYKNAVRQQVLMQHKK